MIPFSSFLLQFQPSKLHKALILYNTLNLSYCKFEIDIGWEEAGKEPSEREIVDVRDEEEEEEGGVENRG